MSICLDLKNLGKGHNNDVKTLFSFCSTARGWTQGLILARQVIYHLSHPPVLFALVIFWIGSHVFVLEPASVCDPPTYAFQTQKLGLQLCTTRPDVNHFWQNLSILKMWNVSKDKRIISLIQNTLELKSVLGLYSHLLTSLSILFASSTSSPSAYYQLMDHVMSALFLFRGIALTYEFIWCHQFSK
jgi:hypothetical protein